MRQYVKSTDFALTRVAGAVAELAVAIDCVLVDWSVAKQVVEARKCKSATLSDAEPEEYQIETTNAIDIDIDNNTNENENDQEIEIEIQTKESEFELVFLV